MIPRPRRAWFAQLAAATSERRDVTPMPGWLCRNGFHDVRGGRCIDCGVER